MSIDEDCEKDDVKDVKDDPGAQAIEKFFAQFGQMDSHKQIVLEEFFKELLNIEEE